MHARSLKTLKQKTDDRILIISNKLYAINKYCSRDIALISKK